MIPSCESTNAHQYQLFYKEHHSWLLRWMCSRLDCSSQAQDLTQETFIDVLVKQKQTSLKKPRAYLSSVARNLMIDFFRRKSVEQAYLNTLSQGEATLLISPEDSQCIIETLMELDRLLDDLGERAKQIFLLAQLDGLSYVAIGKQLGISVTTVRKHFIRAMSQCLQLIEDDE